MKNLTMTMNVAIAYTADQWELYDKPGRNEAAADLNKALEVCLNAPGADERSVWKGMQEVQQKHAALGGYDSETSHMIEATMKKVLDRQV